MNVEFVVVVASASHDNVLSKPVFPSINLRDKEKRKKKKRPSVSRRFVRSFWHVENNREIAQAYANDKNTDGRDAPVVHGRIHGLVSIGRGRFETGTERRRDVLCVRVVFPETIRANHHYSARMYTFYSGAGLSTAETNGFSSRTRSLSFDLGWNSPKRNFDVVPVKRTARVC